MPPLPVVSGRETVAAFIALGWQVSRQRGSHVVLTKSWQPVTLSVPDHRELAAGTLRSLIRNAGITVEAFLAAL